MAIDRWKEDMLDGISRVDRRCRADVDALESALKDTLILVEDLVAEVSRLRVMLRERGIEDRDTITG